MATNEPIRKGRYHVLTCGCGKHCSPRCPQLDMDLANPDPKIYARCDLFGDYLVNETNKKEGDPIVLVRRTPKCSLEKTQ